MTFIWHKLVTIVDTDLQLSFIIITAVTFERT